MYHIISMSRFVFVGGTSLKIDKIKKALQLYGRLVIPFAMYQISHLANILIC